MAWFSKTKQTTEENQKEMPDGLWTKCPGCSEVIFKKQLEDNYFTCPSCGYHFRIGSAEYIQFILDENSFIETNTKVRSSDPLNFVDSKPYHSRLVAAYESTQLNDSLTTGYGTIEGKQVSFGCMNFNFIGGSMGAVLGEKFYRAGKYALENKIPFIIVCASGGARMQEAAYSLMQLPKTCAILSELAEAQVPYFAILTDPTTGGASASYGMLGDVNIAEPGALIGFAGPRVIEQTIRRKLPQGFQRSEFQLEHGFVDIIVNRKELKAKLSTLIDWFKD